MATRAYMAGVVELLKLEWPANRTVTVACHGHSVPAGYFATPTVDTFRAYPHLLHRRLKARYPTAVINVVTTAVGGEDAAGGSARFERDVLSFRPDVVTLDYGLNDRRIGLEAAERAWREMIEAALARGVRVILLTPTMDDGGEEEPAVEARAGLRRHAEQIRRLAAEYGVALADSYAAFERYVRDGGSVRDLLSWPNHPNRLGHELVAAELIQWFQ